MAMGRNVTYIPASPNPWSGLLGALGSYLGNQQNQQNEAGAYGATADAMNGIGNMQLGGYNDIQDTASRANPGSDFTNKNNETRIAQGLLPTSMQTPDASMVGQGMIGQPPISKAPQAQQQFFANPNQVADGTQQAIDPKQVMGQYAKDNNPANVTAVAPKTIAEAKLAVNASIPTAMQTLTQKYGAKIAAQMQPMLMQAAQEKISGYQQDLSQKAIQGLVSTFNDPNTSPNQKMWLAAQAKSMYGVDIGSEFKNFNPTPDALLKENGLNGRYDRQSANNIGTNENRITTTQMNNDNRITTTGMNNSATVTAAGIRGSGRSGGSGSKGGISKYLNSAQYVKDLGLNQQLYESKNGGAVMWGSDEAKALQATKRLQAAQKGEDVDIPTE